MFRVLLALLVDDDGTSATRRLLLDPIRRYDAQSPIVGQSYFAQNTGDDFYAYSFSCSCSSSIGCRLVVICVRLNSIARTSPD